MYRLLRKNQTAVMSNRGSRVHWFTLRLRPSTVGQKKLDMAKIQLLRLSQNSQNLLEGKKESSQGNDSLRLMTIGVDLLAVQANEQNVVNSCRLESTLYAKSGTGFINYCYSANLIY